MYISSIKLDEELTGHHGLQPVEMKRLGNVVVLAGKNGAGKTRFLRMLSEYYNYLPSSRNIKKVEKGLEEEDKQIQVTNFQKVKIQQGLANADTLGRQKMNNDIASLDKNLAPRVRQYNSYVQAKKLYEQIIIVPEKIDDGLISFVPKELTLYDTTQLNLQEIDSRATKIKSSDMRELAAAIIPAIRKIIKAYINVTSQDTSDLDANDEEILQAKNDYSKLRSYISIFLGADLKRDKEGNPILFGRRIEEARLSDGQVVLLQFCMALYARQATLDNLIILMDEPENHLHPAALLEVLDRIIENIPAGQLWIATHSIHVLAHFDPSCSYYIETEQ